MKNHLKYINSSDNILLSDFKELQNEIEKRIYTSRDELIKKFKKHLR